MNCSRQRRRPSPHTWTTRGPSPESVRNWPGSKKEQTPRLAQSIRPSLLDSRRAPPTPCSRRSRIEWKQARSRTFSGVGRRWHPLQIRRLGLVRTIAASVTRALERQKMLISDDETPLPQGHSTRSMNVGPAPDASAPRRRASRARSTKENRVPGQDGAGSVSGHAWRYSLGRRAKHLENACEK